jgi:hypothetical protein
MSFIRVEYAGASSKGSSFSLVDSTFQEEVLTPTFSTWHEVYGAALRVYRRRQIPIASPTAAMIEHYLRISYVEHIPLIVDNFITDINKNYPGLIPGKTSSCIKRILHSKFL